MNGNVAQIDSSYCLFDKISSGLHNKGYSIIENALPMDISNALYEQILKGAMHYNAAGVGESKARTVTHDVRRDEAQRIEGVNRAETKWLDWADTLKLQLNQRLLLGLSSFESYFSHFKPGSFNSMHIDAFGDSIDRVVSIIAYLNPTWTDGYGGQLIINTGNSEEKSTCVLPTFGTLVAFYSRDFPHTVLPTWRDRYSVAGWFKINS
jgi:SM-20-related protein